MPVGENLTLLALIGAMFVYTAAMTVAGFRTGRIAAGWVFFRPIMVDRGRSPVLYWLVMLFHVAIALSFVSALFQIATGQLSL